LLSGSSEEAMQTRREFLTAATATLVLVPIVNANCSSGTTSSPVLPGPEGGGEGGSSSSSSSSGSSSGGAIVSQTFTSTTVLGHQHTVTVAARDLTNPPAGGMTYTTSTAQSHTHTVTLSQAQLMTIAGGGSVMVTTSVTNSHTHDFTFMVTKM
jgi:hypothetical protein